MIVPDTVVASKALALPSSGSRPATASTMMMSLPIVRCLHARIASRRELHSLTSCSRRPLWRPRAVHCPGAGGWPTQAPWWWACNHVSPSSHGMQILCTSQQRQRAATSATMRWLCRLQDLRQSLHGLPPDLQAREQEAGQDWSWGTPTQWWLPMMANEAPRVDGGKGETRKAYQILAVWGGLGCPSSRSPANSGPSSLAALVNVESRVLRDSNTKMMLVMANKPRPMDIVTAEGCPVSTLL